MTAVAAAWAADGDGDGLDDRAEQKMLERFRPRFLVSPKDCAGLPIALEPGSTTPRIVDKDTAIYGQAFPVTVNGERLVELHYYHFWRIDCGRMSHAWDVEHVSVLIRGERAIQWLGAAHQATVCDGTHEAPAKLLNAEERGATVWISRGKHGSFLSEGMCNRGCGGDDCQGLVELVYSRVINLGEPSTPLHGAQWTAWSGWRLQEKMRSDFAGRTLAEGRIAFLAPELGPARAVILSGAAALDSLDLASTKTDDALTLSSQKVKGALQRARAWVKAKSGV